MNDSSKILHFPEPEERLCLNCGSADLRTTVEDQTFPYGVGADEVMLHAPVPVRTCGVCSFSYTDDEGEDARHEAVCRHLGVMTPREVESVRKKLGMSRAEFARVTGLGEASLARWESGALIQNTANDRFLFLMTKPGNVALLRQRDVAVAAAEASGEVESIAVAAGSGGRFRALSSSRDFDRVAREARGFRTLS